MVDIILGIDLGLTGAVCFMAPDGEYLSVHDLPVMMKGKGKSRVKNQINPAAFASLLQGELMGKSCILMAKAYVEQVSGLGINPKNKKSIGSASIFSLGDTNGVIRGVIGALGIPIEFVNPTSWKKHFKLTSDKEVCRAKAIELFPAAPLERKRDHNRAEAILIAKYGCHIERK